MYILWPNSELIEKICFILQRVSERVGGAEGTKLDYDFTEMEKVSSFSESYDSLSREHGSEHVVVY